MFEHAINPTILSLGPLEIRWYGLMYVLAFLFIFYYCKRAIQKEKLALTEKQLDDLLGLMVVAMILGARLFYAVFYNPTYFLESPLKLFAVWEGGLSFHGGLLGIILACAWYFRRHKLKFFEIADVMIIPLSLASAFGRIGNFINAELYGTITNLPWAVVFPGVEGARHPTQLYEAAYNIIIFLILLSTRNKNWKQGTRLGLFLILYGIFRFSVEFIKDLQMYGPLTMGQWLTIPVFLAGIYLVYGKNRQNS